MGKRIVCSLASTAIVIFLLVSCGQPKVTPTAAPPTSKESAPPTTTGVQPVSTPATGKPQYGGVVRLMLGQNILDFDAVYGKVAAPSTTIHQTNEELWTGDWTNGPAGTGETDWEVMGLDRWEYKAGNVAESWEFPEAGTVVWNIRHGIHWALNPNSEASRLVNGRELTADDVVFTLSMYRDHPRSDIYASYPELRPTQITARDKFTVVMKMPTPRLLELGLNRFGDFSPIVPREVVDKYGDMTNWKNSVGTGPFMLTDFVSNSSATFDKNPNYWGKDPIGPGKGSQIPYIDGVKMLIITDASTREAAFRTGKIERFGADWEQSPRLTKEHPELLSKRSYSDSGNNIHFNLKNPLFSDGRVRRALMMATDFNTVSKQLYGPDSQILTWPDTYNKQYKDSFLPLEEAPATVKELYTYSPEKAKALLKDAGYPNGFKVKIIADSGTATVDYLSVIKDMWAKVGVDLTIDAREYAVWTSIMRAREYDQLLWAMSMGLAATYRCQNFRGDSRVNASFVNDPYVEDMWGKIQDALLAGGQKAADPIHKELMKYVLDQAWAVPTPRAPGYYMWWPWLKNYHGEWGTGYFNQDNWTRWAWIDQDMKRSMGY